MLILAVESSCDETAVALVRDGREVLTDQIFSQAALHAVYGGVVPEIASRSHVEVISQLAGESADWAERKARLLQLPPETRALIREQGVRERERGRRVPVRHRGEGVAFHQRRAAVSRRREHALRCGGALRHLQQPQARRRNLHTHRVP